MARRVRGEGCARDIGEELRKLGVFTLRAKYDFVLVKDRRAGTAVVVLEFPQTHQPKPFAAKIKHGHHDLFDECKRECPHYGYRDGGFGAARYCCFSFSSLEARLQLPRCRRLANLSKLIAA